MPRNADRKRARIQLKDGLLRCGLSAEDLAALSSLDSLDRKVDGRMPRDTSRHRARKTLKKELVRCGFTEAEADDRVLILSASVKIEDIFNLAYLFAEARGTFEAEKQKLEITLAAETKRWESVIEAERRSRRVLLEVIEKLLEQQPLPTDIIIEALATSQNEISSSDATSEDLDEDLDELEAFLIAHPPKGEDEAKNQNENEYIDASSDEFDEDLDGLEAFLTAHPPKGEDEDG
jgi:hypothetical protein